MSRATRMSSATSVSRHYFQNALSRMRFSPTNTWICKNARHFVEKYVEKATRYTSKTSRSQKHTRMNFLKFWNSIYVKKSFLVTYDSENRIRKRKRDTKALFIIRFYFMAVTTAGRDAVCKCRARCVKKKEEGIGRTISRADNVLIARLIWHRIITRVHLIRYN